MKSTCVLLSVLAFFTAIASASDSFGPQGGAGGYNSLMGFTGGGTSSSGGTSYSSSSSYSSSYGSGYSSSYGYGYSSGYSGSGGCGYGSISYGSGGYGGSGGGGRGFCGTSAGELQRQADARYGMMDEGPSLRVQTGHYFLSRWYDLIDIVDFSIGAGPGFLVNARATKIAQFGFGYSDAYRAGFRGRSAGTWHEKRFEAGVSLLYWQKICREHISGWVEDFRADKMDLDTAQVYLNNNDRAFTGIGATVHALLLVDINVRPAQAADFVLGWFGIDVLDDDTLKLKRNKDL